MSAACGRPLDRAGAGALLVVSPARRRSASGRSSGATWKLDADRAGRSATRQPRPSPRRGRRPGRASATTTPIAASSRPAVTATTPRRWCRRSTELGGGYLGGDAASHGRGFTVLVNRGFVPPRAARPRRCRRPRRQTVTGLLRAQRARRRLPAQQRSRRRPLVFARRRRDRRGRAGSARRPLFHRCRANPRPAGRSAA